MRKLLNTIYVTNEQAYLSLENNNLVCSVKDETKLKVPLDNIENIVCFSYLGCSPSLMGECVKKRVPINFVAPSGKFLAKVYGETKGNVSSRLIGFGNMDFSSQKTKQRRNSAIVSLRSSAHYTIARN